MQAMRRLISGRHFASLAALCVSTSLVSAQSNNHTPPADRNFELVELTSKVFGNSRTLRVLLPPGYSDNKNSKRRYPVLYFNDGYAVFTYWKAPETVYRLINAGEIEPVIVVCIDNASHNQNDADKRTNEYLPYSDQSEPSVPTPQGKLY